MKRLAILTVALAVGFALSPASWKWGPPRAKADDAVVIVVVTPEGEQFVASTTEPQLTEQPYLADVVTDDGTSYEGATVEVVDPADAESLGLPSAGVAIVDSWSW